MKLKNLCKILYLQILVQISFQIDCVIQNSILNVPSAGCNLPYAQNQITQVDQLILNGQLTISRYASLQYKTLVVNDGAAMNLKSNYEQIKIEDIGTDSCSLSDLKPVTMSLSSKSQNLVYDILSISNSNQLTLRYLPLGLFHGVKILISSVSGRTEYAIVDKIVDKVVYLQNPLSNNHLSQQVIGYSLQIEYPQLLVIDEQRIIFKNACLRIIPQKPQDYEMNSGILFQDMKGLSYENQDKTNILGLTQSIFLNSDNFKNQFLQIIQLTGQITDIIIIGVNQLTINLKYSIKNISMYRMNQSSLNINALDKNFKAINLFYLYSNDCQVTLRLDSSQKQYSLFNAKILNTELIISSLNQKYYLKIEASRLLNSNFRTIDGNAIQLVVSSNFIAGKELNLQNVQYNSAIISQNYFDGTGLRYAILLTELSVLQKNQAVLSLNLEGNVFSNFEYQGYDLITTSLQSTNYQEIVLRPSQTYYKVFLQINFFNILPSSQQKAIFLPSLSLQYQDNYSSPKQFLIPLDDSLYNNTRFIRVSPLTNIFYHKPLYFFKSRLATFQFDIGQATGYHMDALTQEFKQTWQIDTSYYLLENTIYKAYFKSTLNNQLQAAPQQLNFVLYQGNITTFNSIPQIKIYFKASTPIQAINVTINKEPQKSLQYVSIDPIDGCLNIYPQQNPTQEDININITITNCQDEQVLSNQKCVSKCPDGQYPLNSICQDGKQKDGYFFENKQYQPCLGGANNQCKTCTTSNDCQSCFLPDFLKANLCYANQFKQFNSGGSFQNCIQNCQSCQNQQTCSVCVDGYALSEDKKSCNLCTEGNFIKNYQCIPCPSNLNCADCFSDKEGSCRSCKPGMTLVKGFCQQICIQGQYLDDNGICQSCHPTCLECNGNGNADCTRCPKGRIFSDSYPYTCDLITCTSLKFQNNKNECQNCFDQTNQNGCFDAYPNSIICDPGYFAQQNVSGCQRCDASCKTCQYQSTNCIECNQDYSFISGNSGQCQKCQDGFYAPVNAKTCLSCSSPCKTCSGSSNNCLTCLDGFYFDNTSKQCARCDFSCSKCSGSSTNCTECQRGQFLNNGKCINCDVSCKECDGSSTNCTECQSGQFLNNGKCINCDVSCKECYGSSINCTECQSSQFLNNGTCIKCDANCMECMDTSTHCTKCSQNAYLSQNKCLSDCPQGQYADSQLRICTDCDKSKSNNCQTCLDGFYLDNTSLQCSKCDFSCSKCSGSSTNCTECQSGQFLNNGKCINCDVSCKECDGSSTNCTKCQSGQFLNNGKCINCDVICKECYGSSTNCTECQSSQFLNNGTCIKCDANCMECMDTSTHCTKCSQNAYLSQNKCLSDCPQGQYADSQLRICTDCDKSKSKECLNMQYIKQSETQNGLEQGALVGIVVGSFAFFTAVIITLRYFYKKRKYKSVIQINPSQENFTNNAIFTNNQIYTQRDIETKSQLNEKKNQEEAIEQRELKVINID
ncbi:surface protein (macronuclear) [Tetrahymena thermophila SB210]|uniref:Surface protein n=1 Tax=Tetrahymena thermophila (strain SB210) TaxID=312017 RepID=W7XEW3_TETTS|nr:surface protein [Tetrahymena thermophila SB210]EWS76322.1 surface protein [Tetrahymena thermophila SB210]|eukprot:XP_012651106.1 surface protein [Tetrahymena thermophila SB210]